MKKHVFTLILGALVSVSLSAQSTITEPGATEPNPLYTTTYDNPSGPNRAPGGPNRAAMNEDDGFEEIPDPGNPQPIGAPWALLAFAATYGALYLIRKRKGLKD